MTWSSSSISAPVWPAGVAVQQVSSGSNSSRPCRTEINGETRNVSEKNHGSDGIFVCPGRRFPSASIEYIRLKQMHEKLLAFL